MSTMNKPLLIPALLLAALLAACGGQSSGGSTVATVPAATATDEPTVVVHKSPYCGCCDLWVDHLKDNGFAVEVHDHTNINAMRQQLGVPQPLASCHTAVVDGYLVEGHVPASDIRRLLAQRPAGKGIAVPGMPIGSPGMEQGDRVDAYDVLLFDDQGRVSVFAHHPGS